MLDFITFILDLIADQLLLLLRAGTKLPVFRGFDIQGEP